LTQNILSAQVMYMNSHEATKILPSIEQSIRIATPSSLCSAHVLKCNRTLTNAQNWTIRDCCTLTVHPLEVLSIHDILSGCLQIAGFLDHQIHQLQILVMFPS